MGAAWEAYVEKLKKADKDIKEALKDLIKSAKEHSEGFLNVQGEYIEMYLDQLAKGELTKDQFKDNVQLVRDIIEMEKPHLDPTVTPHLTQMQEKINKVILEGLIKAV